MGGQTSWSVWSVAQRGHEGCGDFCPFSLPSTPSATCETSLLMVARRLQQFQLHSSLTCDPKSEGLSAPAFWQQSCDLPLGKLWLSSVPGPFWNEWLWLGGECVLTGFHHPGFTPVAWISWVSQKVHGLHTLTKSRNFEKDKAGETELWIST